MTDQIPMPDLAQSVRRLHDTEDFPVVLDFLKQERERCFADLRQAESPHDVMKLAGSIATLQELSEILSG